MTPVTPRATLAGVIPAAEPGPIVRAKATQSPTLLPRSSGDVETLPRPAAITEPSAISANPRATPTSLGALRERLERSLESLSEMARGSIRRHFEGSDNARPTLAQVAICALFSSSGAPEVNALDTAGRNALAACAGILAADPAASPQLRGIASMLAPSSGYWRLTDAQRSGVLPFIIEHGGNREWVMALRDLLSDGVRLASIPETARQTLVMCISEAAGDPAKLRAMLPAMSMLASQHFRDLSPKYQGAVQEMAYRLPTEQLRGQLITLVMAGAFNAIEDSRTNTRGIAGQLHAKVMDDLVEATHSVRSAEALYLKASDPERPQPLEMQAVLRIEMISSREAYLRLQNDFGSTMQEWLQRLPGHALPQGEGDTVGLRPSIEGE